MLEPTLAEIEQHVHALGWDHAPMLFALVQAARFAADDPVTAARLGVDAGDGAALTPVEQEDLPDAPLDEMLAGIAWPDAVGGAAVTQEIVVLPPSAEAELAGGGSLDAGDVDGAVRRAADHPQRREGRLVAGVLRDGSSAVLLRLRGVGDAADDVVTGPELAPNLVAALLATFD